MSFPVTVSDVLSDIGAVIDQDPTLPSGTELTNRIQLINRAQNDWADAYDWELLRVPYSITVQLSAVSAALPSNFKTVLTPIFDKSQVLPTRYLRIPPDERFTKLSTDKYYWVGGNFSTGRYVNVNPGMTSGASLVFDYKAYPSSLATTNDTIVCPNREYLVDRASYYILMARSDSRFPQLRSDSEQELEDMVSDEDSNIGSENNQIPDVFRKNNFRIGRDG